MAKPKLEMITAEQLKAFHSLYNKVKPPLPKGEMIYCYSDGRTSSSRELTKAEATALIKALKELQPPDPYAIASEKMRKKIISMAHEMGWRLPGGKINMDSVNGWCVKNGYLKKHLDAHSYEELPMLVSQFEKVYEHYLNNLSKTA